MNTATGGKNTQNSAKTRRSSRNSANEAGSKARRDFGVACIGPRLLCSIEGVKSGDLSVVILCYVARVSLGLLAFKIFILKFRNSEI